MVDDGERSRALAPRSPGAGPGRLPEPVYQEQTTVEVVNLLTEVRELQEEAGRSTLVHAIGEALGTPVLLPGHGNPKIQLYQLVVECRKYSDGMTALVEAVEFLAGRTVAAARLRRLLSPVRNLLEPVVETQIEDLLIGLRVPSLARLYHAAAGSSVAPVPRHLNDAWDVFSVLLDHNRAPDRPPPHLTFAAMLLQSMQGRDAGRTIRPEDAQRAKQLREWLTGEIEKLRRDGATGQADELERIRDRSEPFGGGSGQPLYLIIQVESMPELDEGCTMCRLSHWRQVHQACCWTFAIQESKFSPVRIVV